MPRKITKLSKRYSNDLHAVPMNTKIYGWNPLPSEIKSIKSIKQFKESLKSHI